MLGISLTGNASLQGLRGLHRVDARPLSSVAVLTRPQQPKLSPEASNRICLAHVARNLTT